MPVPLPLLLRLLAVVGLGLVLHTTPRCVTDVPPLAVILPPEVAEMLVMLPMGKVLSVANTPGLLMV